MYLKILQYGPKQGSWISLSWHSVLHFSTPQEVHWAPRWWHKSAFERGEDLLNWFLPQRTTSYFIPFCSAMCPEGTTNLHEQWPKCPWSPLLLYDHFFPSLCLNGKFPTISWQTRRRFLPGLQMVLHNIWAPLESGQLQHCSSFLEHPWGQW